MAASSADEQKLPPRKRVSVKSSRMPDTSVLAVVDTLELHYKPRGLAIMYDGTLASCDRSGGCVHLHARHSNRPLASIPNLDAPFAVVASCAEPRIIAESRHCLDPVAGAILAARSPGSGRLAVLTPKAALVFEIETGYKPVLVATLTHSEDSAQCRPTALAFIQNDHMAVTFAVGNNTSSRLLFFDMLGDRLARGPWIVDGPLSSIHAFGGMLYLFGFGLFVQRISISNGYVDTLKLELGDALWPLVAMDPSGVIVTAYKSSTLTAAPPTLTEWGGAPSGKCPTRTHEHYITRGTVSLPEAMQRYAVHGMGEITGIAFDRHGGTEVICFATKCGVLNFF